MENNTEHNPQSHEVIPEPSSSKKISAIAATVVIILIVGGAIYAKKASPVEPSNESQMQDSEEMMEDGGDMMENENSSTIEGALDMTSNAMDENAMPEASGMETQDQAMQESNVVEAALTGHNFAFSRSEIRVKKGDQVKIIFSSTEGFHDWTIDEFSAATERVNAGETSSVEFVADKTGEFEYYCSVGSHRSLGMVGKLIVE